LLLNAPRTKFLSRLPRAASRRRRPSAPLPFARTFAMSDHVKKGQKFQNREAFKAHRNIKRAVRDVDAEAALKQKACAGVCRRCAQKVRPCVFCRKARSPTTHEAALRPHLSPALTPFRPPSVHISTRA